MGGSASSAGIVFHEVSHTYQPPRGKKVLALDRV
jgi:hypothetical protein